jgi:ABC-type phosphate/phosphonate transport system substrate-binding protein
MQISSSTKILSKETPVHFEMFIKNRFSLFFFIIRERIKDFLDLRGANWATNSSSSTSGHFVMLKALKEYGENPSFFGSVLSELKA